MTETALIDLKERIAISDVFSPAERDFLLIAADVKNFLDHVAPDQSVQDRIKRMVEDAAPVALHAPPNYMGRIDRIWAFLSLDDGGEGMVAAPIGGMTAPLIAADKKRLDSLIPMAKHLAKVFGKPIRLAKFDQRTDVEIYQP
jgi:hypothetical protein